MELPSEGQSLWARTASPGYPALVGDAEADVVVVGGGIAGLTTAALLAEAGRDVLLLEARTIGCGTSGRTTAKVAALQGTRYRTIARHHGADVARRYARSQLDALAWMEERVGEFAAAFQWEARPAITYATTAAGRDAVDEEAAAAAAAGLQVALVDTALPFATTRALELADQAQFDPQPYLLNLAAGLDARDNAAVHEDTRVVAVHGERTHTVVTERGSVRADHVVIATLLPIVDRGLFFARSEPKSSSIVALDVDGDIPAGMYLSADSPTRSMRSARHDGHEVLLVGGEGHPTGRGAPTLARQQELVDWAARHFTVRDVVARWGAHDYVPADHLPWVGPAWPLSPHLLVATGFEKWGMTMGTAAALALADRILGVPDGPSGDWAGIFSPTRITPRGAVSTARINLEVASRLVTDWARPDRAPEADGGGARARHALKPVGRPDPGTELSVVCTHLGGVCEWNGADRTWDCPLHGSRFDADGAVLTGPATKPLADPSDR